LARSAWRPRYTQNSFVVSDVFSLLKGVHTLNFGGSLTRLQDNLKFAGFGSFLEFLSWPDFLLGLDGSANGVGNFSNVFASEDVFGLLNRELRAWEGSGFAQDDYRITGSLTLNLGVRYQPGFNSAWKLSEVCWTRAGRKSGPSPSFRVIAAPGGARAENIKPGAVIRPIGSADWRSY
jgi:hypothetical protein